MQKKKKFLYYISQSTVEGYDTYSDMVVCAYSEEDARRIHPNGNHIFWDEDAGKFYSVNSRGVKEYESDDYPTWALHIKDVQVEKLGNALDSQKVGKVLASFHAG